MPDRNKGGDDFGIISTSVASQQLSEDYLENLSLLDNKPEDVEPVTKKKTVPPKKVEEDEEQEEEDQVPVNTEISDEESDDLFVDKKKKRRDDSLKDEPQPEEVEEEKEEVEEESESDVIPNFSRELFESGILTKDEDEEEIEMKTPEDLFHRFNHEKRKGAVQILENILSNFGEEYREAFNAIYLNGVNPKEYFNHLAKIENLSELDLSIVDNQKTVMRHHYKSEFGWDDNKIATKLERLENIGELEEESKEIHQSLVNKEAQALETRKEEQRVKLLQEQQMEQDFYNSVHRILADKLKSKDFDGIPVDQKTASSTAGYLTEKRWQLPSGRKLSDFEKDILDMDRPENREAKVKYAMLLQILKQDPTLSRLQKKAVAKETNNLFSSLQRAKSTAKKQGRTISNFFDD